MGEARFDHFEHGSDIGVRGFGPTLEEAFAQVGLAVTAVITDPKDVEPRIPVDVRCAVAPSVEDLLYDFLDALVFEMSTRGMLFSRFELHSDGKGLQGRMLGEPIDPTRHELAVEVKGPTYSELRVRFDRRSGEWLAQSIVDV
ncbi:MAG: archease [Polyangiaceae bacterium]|nr:archease [Polyangiaceae bacterium]